MADHERETPQEHDDHGKGPLEAIKDYAEHAVKVLEPRESDLRATTIEEDEPED